MVRVHKDRTEGICNEGGFPHVFVAWDDEREGEDKDEDEDDEDDEDEDDRQLLESKLNDMDYILFVAEGDYFDFQDYSATVLRMRQDLCKEW